jgi:hypothetical protein
MIRHNSRWMAETKPSYERRHYRLQLALLVVGIVVAFIYAGQLYEMQKSTHAATQAAKAAKNSINLSRENAHLDQRAWVAQDSLNGKAESGKPYTITILVKNTGKTFAKNFVGIDGWASKQLSDPDPDFDSLITAEGTVNNSVGLLPPNGTVTQSLEIPKDGRKMTDDDIQRFNDPTRVYFIFGKLTYFDIFQTRTLDYLLLPRISQYGAVHPARHVQ